MSTSRSSLRSSSSDGGRQTPEAMWFASYRTRLAARGLVHRGLHSDINNAGTRRNANTSPRALRELERVAEYQRKQKKKDEIRRIIKTIQEKRRQEFRILRVALGEIYNYNGQYLQRPGEKQAAAELLRAGGLGKEFVYDFDKEAKWKWLQLRVRMAYNAVCSSLSATAV
ncbi:hypothetical protein DFH28DRAFT_1136166 [Melampsora americana]|nr:hypothetical protein DFH28DRAFT_1136166 [Melampsora americana]